MGRLGQGDCLREKCVLGAGRAGQGLRLDGQDKLKVRMELPGAAERIRVAGELLTALAAR